MGPIGSRRHLLSSGLPQKRGAEPCRTNTNLEDEGPSFNSLPMPHKASSHGGAVLGIQS
jgi:hypothetical protein